jgi:hypothetical protein
MFAQVAEFGDQGRVQVGIVDEQDARLLRANGITNSADILINDKEPTTVADK